MDPFTEEHSKSLLGKEWLVKIDSENSIPYLFKFNYSPMDFSSCILVTDTRNIWSEVLPMKRFARRWRDLNPEEPPEPYDDHGEEHAWRCHNLARLSKLHTLADFSDSTFGIIQSQNADFAMELECEHFKWKWETYAVGPKTSADVLSKHLIMPLISMTHLTFTAPNPVSELSEDDLLKAVDKTGKTARRTVDTHVKNAMSNPRVATTLQRMTALLNFIPSLPAIVTSVENIDISIPFQPAGKCKSFDGDNDSQKHTPNDVPGTIGTNINSNSQAQATSKENSDSETEPESDAEDFSKVLRKYQNKTAPSSADQRTSMSASKPKPHNSTQDSQSAGIEDVSKQRRSQSHVKTPTQESRSSSDQESSPHRPKKKAKAKAVVTDLSSEAENSEEERRKRMAKIVSGAKTQRGGARQPLKRGGRRF